MRVKSRTREAIWGFIFISPWIVGFLIWVFGPIIASLYYSFTDYELFTSPTWIGFDNYVELFKFDPLFWKSVYNTIYYTAISLPLGVFSALLLALLLNRGIMGVTVYRTIFFLPAITTGVAVSLLWLWLFNPQYGLINYVLKLLGINGPGWLVDEKWAKPAFIIMSFWSIGYTIVIFLAGLQGVPKHLYESAEIDGAGIWHKFWVVTWPMISPIVLFNLIIGIIFSFQIFTQVYIMTEGAPEDSTLFYVLYLFRRAFEFFQMGVGSAMAWILFIIVLVVTLIQFLLSRWWVYYEAGGVK